jgi:hypothetical protein
MGLTFDAVDCISRPETYAATSPYSGEVHIYTFGSACSKYEAQAFQKNSGDINIAFDSSQLAPGTYASHNSIALCTSPPCVDVNVTLIGGDARCAILDPYPRFSTGGSVVVTEVSSAGIKGTFDLTFGTDHITGSFDAPTCGPASAPATCQ